jgi:FkbM family methyltransferase
VLAAGRTHSPERTDVHAPLLWARRIVRRSGFDVVRYGPGTSASARRIHLFERYGIGLVLDVGANVGQYALSLRRDGYAGRILSFEPLSAACATLQRAAGRDHAWQVLRCALGDRDGTAILNVAGNSVSSSVLAMLPAHLRSAPESAYVGTEEVPLRRLDSVLEEHGRPGERAFLKVDAQGSERAVMEGAAGCLDAILGVQLEMPLTPLYQGEASMPELVEYLAERGFFLMSLEPAWSDPASGRVLQVDGMFFREPAP